MYSHPLTFELCEQELEGDVDREFLLTGFKYGFHIIDNEADLTPVTMSNYKSVTCPEVRQQAEKQIIAELELGNYSITQEPPTIISALGAIPKPDSDRVWLIHDCSRPTNNSMNSHNTDHKHFPINPWTML